MRIILYLGKGGVGKTTISAATAVRSAMLGKRTLVVSTDLAHSLADCLNKPLTSEPKELATNLWAQEVNALDEMRRGPRRNVIQLQGDGDFFGVLFRRFGEDGAGKQHGETRRQRADECFHGERFYVV